MKKAKALCLWDVPADDASLAPLRDVADITVRKPDRAWVLEHVHEYDVYLAALGLRRSFRICKQILATPRPVSGRA